MPRTPAARSTVSPPLRRRPSRVSKVETLERRQLMAVDAIHVGLVYLETDYLASDGDQGRDSEADRWLLSFTGGAPGTQLEELRINTDKYGDGMSIGDPIFDTEAGGLGKDEFHDFAVHRLETANGTPASVTASVADGGQMLVLRFTGFETGDRLEFTIDVDQVLTMFDDVDRFNQSLDVITSGQEFHDSILKATFVAPNYFPSTTDARFVNDFGDPWSALNLDLPPDDGPTVDSFPNRSAAALASATQTPIPASISGFVYRDDNDSGTRDAGEIGLSGVPIRLEPLETIAAQATLTTTTRADGSYAFDGLMPGRYRIIEVTQPPGLTDGRDAAGTIDGRVVGSAINPGDQINEIVLAGGDAGIEYNFGELPLGSIGGFVYLAAPGVDCFGDHDPDDAMPLEDVTIHLVDSNSNRVATMQTNASGAYRFDDLPAGTYSVEQETPEGLLDGSSHVGDIRTIASNLLVGIGTSINGGRITNVALPPGGDGDHYNFCEVAPARLSGHVYHDRDDDGVRESGEEGIDNVTLSLINSAGDVAATTVTNRDGFYDFANLPADVYRIVESQPTGFIDGKDAVGTIAGQLVGELGSDEDSISRIDLRQGLAGINYDFGERQTASLAGRVHVDLDEDCIRDDDETWLGGVTITLFDQAGNQVAQTQTNDDGQYSFDDLVPGTYTVVETQPEGYFEGGAVVGTSGGSLNGPNRITDITLTSGESALNYDFCERPPAEISGLVFVDNDGDCIHDPDEQGLSGVIVQLFDDSGKLVATTQTGSDGRYHFQNLEAGSYRVVETQPDGFFHGGQIAGSAGGNDLSRDVISEIPISWGQRLTDYNFCELPPSELSGVVYVDVDQDCVRDEDEVGLSGVAIELFDDTGRLIATTQTADDGSYSFRNLAPGMYTVRETQPDGYFHGGQVAGSGGGDDRVRDVISSINVGPGELLTDYDFCEVPPSQLSGVVYVDVDQNCVRDEDEVGLAGVLIELIDDAGRVVATTQTADDGTYQFDDLSPGIYTVRESQPDGYFHGGQVAGSGGGDDRTDDVISGISVGPGEVLTDYDFCEVPPSSISGLVWSDTQRNNQRDPDEAGLPNVVVELVQQDRVIASTQTDADGRYVFETLRPGDYEVRESQPAGFFHGGQLIGSVGGVILRDDVLGNITLPAGVTAIDYDFPELPPASLAGVVFQDGPPLPLQEAPDPVNLRDYRDGVLTDDDQRLAGVTLELRNVLGLPVNPATSALPGLYDGDVITTTTDALGNYEFIGLRPGATYAVYQVQP
ncbi:MAG: SdrD B-like domain-containing protein, partial [Planctomycetota bacterium]